MKKILLLVAFGFLIFFAITSVIKCNKSSMHQEDLMREEMSEGRDQCLNTLNLAEKKGYLSKEQTDTVKAALEETNIKTLIADKKEKNKLVVKVLIGVISLSFITVLIISIKRK